MVIDFVYLEKNLQDHIVKQFNSKKNSVYLLEHDCQKIVAKVFITSRHQFEFEILQNLYKKNIPVPKPYSLVNQTIFMEYLEGKTLMDIINSNLANKENFLDSLSSFFSSMHEIKKGNLSLLKGDLSIKNFIYRNRIYGLDFEESTYGNNLKDIGGTIAQILDSSPSFTDEKFHLSNYFLEKYLQNKIFEFDEIQILLKNYLIEGLLFDASFRTNQRDEILKWVSKIKKDFDQIFGIQSQ